MQGGRRAGSVLAHTLYYSQYICALLRDKFLRKKGGLILPNETSLYMAGIENEELRQVRALVGGRSRLGYKSFSSTTFDTS